MSLEKLLSELEAKSRAATDKWHARERAIGTIDREMEIVTEHGGILFRSTSYGNMKADAELIGACDKATIERLIAIIRRLEAAVKAEHYCGEPGVDCDACNALADVERIAEGGK